MTLYCDVWSCAELSDIEIPFPGRRPIWRCWGCFLEDEYFLEVKAWFRA